jgi:3-methyladenine DNA glycosylase/8-oxoguanine DNA glycosylase
VAATGDEASAPDAAREVHVPVPYDFDESFRFLLVGPHDPSVRTGPGRLVRAARTPLGPVTLDLERTRDGVRARAWGRGADWTVARLDGLAGLADEPARLLPPPGRLGTLVRRGRVLRLPRTPFVFDTLVAIVLQQRVSFREAARSHRRLVAALDEAAPGPFGLRLPLSPRHWLALSGEDFRRAGIDGQRARALRVLAQRASEVWSVADLGFAEARERLRALPGCGPWTVEMMLAFGLGDPDAVPPGDLHLPHLVTWALSGEPEGDDARMFALLSPFRGQRFRIVRLLYAARLETPARPPGYRRSRPVT